MNHPHISAFDYRGYTIIQFINCCVLLGPAKLGDGSKSRETLHDTRTLFEAMAWIDQRIIGRDRRSYVPGVV